MNWKQSRTLLVALLFALSALSFAYADQWTQPTPEELSMTSQPQVPGAAAVYLYREEITEDDLHMFSIYVRLKVLTEKGKEFANVELEYVNASEGGGYTINDIAGRTIHPDGTVIPFTGKPYQKLIEKSQGAKVMAKVFSLPDVEVGSIIEYRYTKRYDDHYFFSPQWFIQSDLFTRKAHYLWRPTDKQLTSTGKREQLSSVVAWTPILPKGTDVKQTHLPTGRIILEVSVQDVPPAPDEEYMPPISSLSYRVLFYYSSYRTQDEFWKGEGKYWSKQQDKFIGPGAGVRAAVQQLAAPTDTADQKLRKFYASIMQIENTDFTREHSAREEKSQGLGEIRNTDDILARKRGSGDQLAELFVAMARAAGMKAYVVAVTNRDRHLFFPSYLSLSQLDDYLAIVNVDGKDMYFDPGTRFCPYAHLAWKHTLAGGIRQTDNGAAIVPSAPIEPLTYSRIQRVANLRMDDHGEVTGSVKMTFTGSPALRWRQRSLTGDDASVKRELRTSMEQLMPGGMDVKVVSVDNLDNYELPLTVMYDVKGGIGSPTGKRLVLSGDIFEANSKAAFPHEKRETPVYFEYPHVVQDAVRVTLPPSMTVESLPKSDKYMFQKLAAYVLTTESATNSITFRREFELADVLFSASDYPALRTFYGKMENKDQESVVLKLAAADKPASGN